LPFGFLNFWQSASIISKQFLLSESIAQMHEMQQRMGLPTQANVNVEQMLMTLIYVMLVLSVILLVHLTLTFTLLRKHVTWFPAVNCCGLRF